jgi:hypothetical protein
LALQPSSRRTLARNVALRAAPPLRRIYEEREQLRRSVAELDQRLAVQDRRVQHLERHLARLETPAVGTAGDAQTKLGYLFIVTYGRSGSTLVQGLLDSIPGYLIRGENRGALYHLYEFHAQLLRAQADFSMRRDLDSTDAWYGIDGYDQAQAMSQLRRLVLDTVLRPEPDTRVVGFKEIRWWQKDWRGYLTFLQELFPDARFVINTRDHEAVSKSLWWGKRPKENVLRLLDRYEKRLNRIEDFLGPAAYRIHYDDYVADPGTLNGLFEWLGEPFDRETVDSVMGVNHSFKTRSPSTVD